MARRHISEVVKSAVLEELGAGTPGRTLSRKYEISEGTISRWKKEAGIDDVPFLNAIVRSKPLRSDKPEGGSGEESTTDRRALIRKQLALIDDLLEEGHLKSSDLRNLASASKTLGEADARLEREEQEEQARATIQQTPSNGASSLGSNSSREARLVELVSTDRQGLPVYAEAYYAVEDYEDTLERNLGQEEVDQAWARMCEVLRTFGVIRVTQDDLHLMNRRMNSDFTELLKREGRSDEEIERMRKEAWAQTPWAGEGLS